MQQLQSMSQTAQKQSDYREKVKYQELKKEREILKNSSCKSLSVSEKRALFVKYEKRISSLIHKQCRVCRCVGLNMNTKDTHEGKICHKCQRLQNVHEFITKALPTWTDQKGKVHYELPDQLKGLTTAEKALIQRISPLIPLHHIKQGCFGLQGHTCAFEQNVTDFVHVLPRLADDVTIIKILGHMRNEIGSSTTNPKMFTVHRNKVEEALVWLCLHNKEYKDVQIDMTRMNWMNGDTDQLPTKDIYIEQDKGDDTDEIDSPAPTQTVTPFTDLQAPFGYIDENGIGNLSAEDENINNTLQHSVQQKNDKNKFLVDWPTIGSEPVKEYGTTKIFARAFPWLFPGGSGDVKDYPGDMAEWGKNLTLYYDGRFVKDKHFCFFALNHIIRNRNNSSGHFFVNSYQKDIPNTLEELQEQIKKGDTRFINNLTFYNKRIKGSNPYWIQKKTELYSWINHHIKMKHGAPMFFITFSCAEHYWPDIINLIRERMIIAGDNADICFMGSPKLPQLINDYAIVIQEYFQKRVILWLEEVGKPMMHITNYWVRYEFAPGRGQIHAHLLAISEDKNIYRICQIDHSQEGEQTRARTLAEWAQNKFGLTATVSPEFDSNNVNPKNSPCGRHFSEIADASEEIIQQDQEELLQFCAVHLCNAFCLKEKTSSSSRYEKHNCLN